MKVKYLLPGAEEPRVIAYHPRLALALGSATDAIFLCQLIHWHGKEKDPNGWMFKTRLGWTQETGLSIHELRIARTRLEARGFIQTTLRGNPPKLHYRVREERLIAFWNDYLLTDPIC